MAIPPLSTRGVAIIIPTPSPCQQVEVISPPPSPWISAHHYNDGHLHHNSSVPSSAWIPGYSVGISSLWISFSGDKHVDTFLFLFVLTLLALNPQFFHKCNKYPDVIVKYSTLNCSRRYQIISKTTNSFFGSSVTFGWWHSFDGITSRVVNIMS